MATFGSHSRKKNSKCLSVNTPLLVNEHPKNPRLCILRLNGHEKASFEANQSLGNNFCSKAPDDVKMEWVKGDSLNFLPFSNGPKRPTNQSPIHASTSRDETWLLFENFLTSAPHPSNSVLFEPNLPYVSPNKAVFTIALPSSQILVVNSAACKLLNYSSDELCAMKLESLLHENHKHRLQVLTESGMKGGTPDIFNSGKVVELVNKDSNTVPVSLFLKKIDTPQRCLIIAEPIERRVAQLSVDRSGKILSCDDEAATIFQYDTSELIGMDLRTLIPSVHLVKDTGQHSEEICKQKLTGRTREGASFPLCLTISRSSPSQESSQVVMWVYSNLSGLIVLNKDLTISNCNHHFTKLLFGIPKTSVLNQNVAKLIPNFCEDLEYGRDGTGTLYQSENSDSYSEKFYENVSEKKSMGPAEKVPDADCDNPTTESISPSFSNTQSQCDYDFKTWCDKLPIMKEANIGNLKKDDQLLKCDTPSTDNSDNKETEVAAELSLKKRSTSACRNTSLSTEVDSGAISDEVKAKDGNYSGYGKHNDGTNIDIIYRVKTVILNDTTLYCVWVSRDPWELAEGGRNVHTNLTLTSSFNSTSLEGSMAKDSNHSEQQTRPSSASIISQCDEILTAGEYSEHYTTLQQIGKGAFGYVKMAYRNSDGLLVITKFIKKQKINARSWVLDPHLNMKVPLEISLLTTLEHPNIVEVLDVFHNESFFQLVMEKHGAGLDLFEFIDRKPKTDEKLDSYIFRQMVSAVHYLDSLGILHRDIKDENVIINEKFQVKLIDFGSATFMSPDKMFSMFYGTVEYCSPEVLQGHKYKGPELEIWALGVTLYVLTFGENPFYDVEETIKGKFSIPSPISSQLYELLHRMLEKNVETRITIDELVKHPWIDQPVDIDQYQFDNVVRCYHEEAYPPRYISEYCMGEKYENQLDGDYDRTVASSNSFCSLHTIENLVGLDQYDDGFEEANRGSKLNTSLYKLNIPSYVLSSTPMKKDREGITKSAGSLHKTWENMSDPINRTNEHYNNNSAQKRFSLDLNILKRINSGTCRLPEGESLLKEEQAEATNSEETASSDLELEIMKELDKLKIIESSNNNGPHDLEEKGGVTSARKTKTKTETTESDDSNQAGCHEFYDSVDHRGFDCGDYECYWDAEDEKFDNDESF